GIYTVTLLAVLCGATLLLWVEAAIWSAVRKLGRRADVLVLLGIHLGLALGVAVGLVMRSAINKLVVGTSQPGVSWWDGLIFGVRMSGTYMGYVVLARVAYQVLGELLSIRWRRVYSIAKLTVVEAVRRMWAPWVVLVVFVVVLAFTHWFL